MLARFTAAHLFIAALISAQALELKPDGYHVFPGQSIQLALEAAARNPTNKVVKVHPGIYRPDTKRQALIWFNRAHDGIRLQAIGEVILTGENREIADPKSKSFPSVVNHVVYFGDGVSGKTEFQGFQVTGANDFFSTNRVDEVEPDQTLEKGLFFFGDGGGIKIFGRSYPVIRDVKVYGNYANPCAGGVSIEHSGHGPGTSPQPVFLENCVFRDNRAEINGPAVDLLPGSHAVISNCLFVQNLGNIGKNYLDQRAMPAFTNAAVLCVFQDSRAIVKNCTFVNNRNGLQDLGNSSVYENCIFWNNTLPGGFYTSNRYEIWIQDKASFKGCFVRGVIIHANGAVTKSANNLTAPDPEFDSNFIPRSQNYRGIGYRPVEITRKSSTQKVN